MALLNVDNLQGDYMGLAAVNYANGQSWLVDATVSGANTYATLRSRVAANIALATNSNEANQFGNVKVLPSMDEANRAGTLTDTRLNGLTTFAAVIALFAADSVTPTSYKGSLVE